MNTDYDNTKWGIGIGIIALFGAYGFTYCIACSWGDFLLFPDVTELNWTTAMDFAVYAWVNANWAWACWLVGGIAFGACVGIGLIVDKVCDS